MKLGEVFSDYEMEINEMKSGILSNIDSFAKYCNVLMRDIDDAVVLSVAKIVVNYDNHDSIFFHAVNDAVDSVCRSIVARDKSDYNIWVDYCGEVRMVVSIAIEALLLAMGKTVNATSLYNAVAELAGLWNNNRLCEAFLCACSDNEDSDYDWDSVGWDEGLD